MATALRIFVLRGDSNAQALWAFLRGNWRQLADAGKPLAITVAEHKAKRSIDQNKRLWVLLNEISASAWLDGSQFTADAWHEYFKRKFIGTEELPGGGSVGISTTALDVSEFAAYMTRIEVYASQELGIEFAT
jgi:hypothetical protein